MFLSMTPKKPGQRGFVHVDFYALDVDKPITADVNIVFEGMSPAVKELGEFWSRFCTNWK